MKELTKDLNYVVDSAGTHASAPGTTRVEDALQKRDYDYYLAADASTAVHLMEKEDIDPDQIINLSIPSMYAEDDPRLEKLLTEKLKLFLYINSFI